MGWAEWLVCECDGSGRVPWATLDGCCSTYDPRAVAHRAARGGIQMHMHVACEMWICVCMYEG